MKKILITGSKGQLGNELFLLHKEFKGFSFLFHDIDTLDLTDFKALERFILQHKPEFIVNCAAYTAVDKAEEEMQSVNLLNAEVPGKLAELSDRFNSFFIHISTDYVFDGRNHRPYKEDDLPNPLSVYGKSKFMGEQKVMIHNNSIVIRTSWLYSQFGHNFIKTILRLGREKSSLSVVYDQIGAPTYARDLATVILELIRYTEQNHYPRGIFHYSNEGVCSWYDFAKEINDIAGLNCKIIPITTDQYPLPAERPYYSIMDKSKIKKTLGIEIPYWKDSLKVCLKNIL